MAYNVTEAHLERDRKIMIDILNRNRTREDMDYDKRFEWAYLQNPLGEARAWIIWDDKTNKPVGFTGVFPREVYIDGRKRLGWNCGDFSIEKKYRTLGVALKLRKKAKEAIDLGEIPFLYAHPNERMELIHLRAGHHKVARMVRYALPVRVNEVIRNKVPFKPLADAIALPINILLTFQHRFRTFLGVSGHILSQVNLGEQHERMFAQMTETFEVIGSRDLAYLKWKFSRNPNHTYKQFDMYYKNHLVGTIFFVKKGNTIHVIDILLDDFRRFSEQLFRYFVNVMVKTYRDIKSISFILQEFNPYVPVLKALGFKYRDDATSAVIVYANKTQDKVLADKVLDGHKWFMTVGDRDA